MKHILYFLMLFLLLFSCNNKKEKSIEEKKIIEKIINEKIYSIANSKIMKTKEFQKIIVNENFTYSKIEKIRDSVLKNQKFYFSISDTLFGVKRNSGLYKTAMKQFVFVPVEDSIISKELNFRNLSIKSNLIRLIKITKSIVLIS